MYMLQRQRYQELISSIEEDLEAMALDLRAFPGVVSGSQLLKSSASTPSLRSRESELVEMGRSTPDNGAGNVRVVVRVRGFLPRGTYLYMFAERCAEYQRRDRKGSGVPRANEP